MEFNNLSDEELIKFLSSQYPYEEIINAISEAKRRGLKLPEGLNYDALYNDENGTWISGNDFWISGLRFFCIFVICYYYSDRYFIWN